MPKYDINDPTDLDIMRAQFDMYTHEEWDEYVELAEEKNLGYKNVNILKSASRKAGIAKYLSPKVINWVLSLVDRLEEILDDEEE
ncbi:MAG: exodeoxyribonuclease V alpha subunit [Paraglaciecola sp.]|jgi:exodeoxyribonuclease V alpha subunit